MKGIDVGRPAWITIPLAIALLSGCAGPATSTFSPPLDPADAMVLSKGYHEISPCFGYETEGGGLFTARRILIYHVLDPEKGEPKELLGSMAIGYLGNTCYRPTAYAVSEDGRVLLYRHDGRPPKGKTSGLYEFTHGSGERLLHRDPGWVESRPLPRDAFLFSLGDLSVRDHYIRTTGGDEYPADVHGGNALHRAAYLGQAEHLLELLGSGLDLDARDARGFTPLHEAIWTGRVDAVEALLDHGASMDVTIPNLEWSPLHEAARFGHEDIVDVLLDRGADVNARNALGKSPYDLAVEFKMPATAEHLVGRGARVHAGE